MGRTPWDQEELVRGSRKGRYVLGNLQRRTVMGKPQPSVMVSVVRFSSKSLDISVFAQAEEYPLLCATDHDVIGLVLGVRPTKYGPHVLRSRVAVHREVAPADRVQVVEADGERRAEHLVHDISKHMHGVQRHHELEREFHLGPVGTSDQHACLRGRGAADPSDHPTA